MVGRKVIPFLGLLWLGLVTAAVAAPQARLVPEDANFDFGRLREGEKVEHLFRFANPGDANLEITDVRSSCGCTAVVLSERIIPAGGVGELRAVFDSNGFRGPVTKTITVTSNAAPEPFTHFQLTGVVVPLLEVDPFRLEVRGLVPGVDKTVQAQVTNQSTQPIRVLSVRSTSPAIRAELTPMVLAPGATGVLKVTVKLEPNLPRISGYVYLETDHPQARNVRLTFRGYGR